MNVDLLSETRSAATHDLPLADEFGTELGPVQRQVDIEVDSVEGSLGGVHALEVLLEVLAGQVRGQGDNFFYTCFSW